MSSKKDILGNELMREIVAIRIDTLWKMLLHEDRGDFPDIDEEGATGRFDNKGAIFIPGGLIFRDVDEKSIIYEPFGKISDVRFREHVRAAMHCDNATLLYADGMASGINLDSGFFARAARRIYTFKKAAFRRKVRIGPSLPRDITSDDIARSHCPTYMKPPYGARTRISACAAIALVDSPMFFAFCKSEWNATQSGSDSMAAGLDRARDLVRSADGSVLYPPYIVVCHDTRYKENSYTGLTRILGLGKFGEFATFTLEALKKPLLDELSRKRLTVGDEDIVAIHGDRRIVGVLRIYAPTSLGKRSLNYTLHLVSPAGDLKIDTALIEASAKDYYGFSG